jgi:hypothetical protein
MPARDVQVRNVQAYSLIAGIANSLATVIGTVAVIFGGLGTCGVGCILMFYH